ncbi:Glutathione S-transferase zeta-1 [Coemansia sp. IMI 203386]|nr:Glutathione S-transferase zeta-1 [Coemansia sp. IMI 203386]
MDPQPTRPVLYTYFRSSCSARVRIALNLKGIDYEPRAVNLLRDEHHDDAYTSLNPNGLLPLLLINGLALTQSVAIIEYLDERFPQCPLLPRDPALRASVRAIVGVLCCDIQPLQNMRVLRALSEPQRTEHARSVIAAGLAVVETMLEATAGRFCVGDDVTMADCCLAPQLVNARRFGVDLTAMPRIRAVDDAAAGLDAFRRAHWSRQPDCPPELRASDF